MRRSHRQVAARSGRQGGLALPTVVAAVVCGGSLLVVALTGTVALGGGVAEAVDVAAPVVVPGPSAPPRPSAPGAPPAPQARPQLNASSVPPAGSLRREPSSARTASEYAVRAKPRAAVPRPTRPMIVPGVSRGMVVAAVSGALAGSASDASAPVPPVRQSRREPSAGAFRAPVGAG